MRPSRRALVGVLSVLLPAAGIAYLGTVSYQEDRGIVAEQIEEQFEAADAVAGHLERRLGSALDRIADTFEPSGQRPSPDELRSLREQEPLARRPFLINRSGRLVFPTERPLRASGTAAPDRLLEPQVRPCPERGLVACVRAMRAARRRHKQLAEARGYEVEACAGGDECNLDSRAVAEARRRYTQLVRFDDTGPEALLGLARLARAEGKAEQAIKRYGELEHRFGGTVDADGVELGLIAAVGAAESAGRPAPLLAVYENLLERKFRAPAPVLEVVAERLRSQLDQLELDAGQRDRLAALDRRLALARSEVRFADSLEGEVDELASSAVAQTRGRPARGSSDTIIYRRQADGSVIGALVDRATLSAVVAESNIELDRLAEGARPVVVGVGESRRDAGRTRTLATAGFGQTLPHLTLELVNDRRLPDPLDEIVRRRGRRHLVITGGLVAILVIGLIATIRGAARERELARLKSEFVTTVSHELKTPLTSIRMFAEMLQQNVAGSDRGRERRYHDVIVKESERLGLLIANLLDYSQIERGTRRYETERERAGDILREAVSTFERLREGERPTVVAAAEDGAVGSYIDVDRDVVVQALLNLLANAVKYGGTEHAIEARVERNADQVVFSVRDRGPGIPKAEQPRIFKEFYRTPAAYSSAVEGTGLGLALVKRHVEAQGGQVEVDSVLGKGSTFSLLFPCSPAA